MPRAAKASARTSRPAARLLAAPPLHELGRDQLSAFLYVALVPEESRAVVKELGLSMPGFRSEGLGDVQRCDLIADEIRASPGAAAPVQRALQAAFGEPPLAGERLSAALAGALARLCASESAAALALWRLLSDRERAVRDAAGPTLDWLAREYYGPRQGEEARGEGEGGEAEGQGTPPPAAPQPEGGRRLEELERALARAQGEAEEARRRGEAQREKIQAQLKEARAREAQALDEAARARGAAEGARREAERAQVALAATQATDLAQEAQRARAAARDLEARSGALEGRLERSRRRERELEAELAAARAGRAPAAPPAPAGVEAAEAEPEEALATWLRPIYTKEFHDSLEGWDRRIQRAAFKQAHLLAQDHRHPSLRAIPLEGLPGYYRVRVATDVRLIYRRGDKANTVEILSLIDREDLDRYIRQAKTRG